jgi:hypothetical protein
MISDHSKSRNDIDQAEITFNKIFTEKPNRGIQPYKTRKTYRRIYTPLILIWCLIYQRLNPDHSCDAVVNKLRSGGFDQIDKDANKAKLSQRCRSESTAAYCKARKRTPIQFIEQVMEQSAQYAQSIPVKAMEWLDRKVYLLDGTTLLLRPTPDLVRHYGQHKTAKKTPYWVVMRMVCLFCLQNGVVAKVKEGPLSTSEQALAENCVSFLSPGDICVGDRGFGMFRMVQAVRHYQGKALFRLSKLRALKLFKEQLYPGHDIAVVWTHSKKDTLNPGMSVDPIPGRLIYVRLERPGFRSQDLYLFTTLVDQEHYTRNRLIQLYGLRWHVELNLRYVKRTMDLYLLESKSVDIVRKELLAGMIAYNLVRTFILLSANQKQCSALALSFSLSLRRVFSFVFDDWPVASDIQSRFVKLLIRISKCKLPCREKPRIEPRWVRPRDKTFREFWTPRNQARSHYVLLRLSLAVC